MSDSEFDLLIRAEQAYCSESDIDGSAVIGIRDGLIEFVDVSGDSRSEVSAIRTIDVADGILLPGFVDLHAHPAKSGSKFGIDADRDLLPKGSTTVLSQGDAGARNLDKYIEETIEGSRTRIKLALNFCAEGESNPNGRFFELSEASVSECVAAVRQGGEHVWGISLNIALIQNPEIDPLEVMRRGMEAADQAGCPVMFGATKNLAVPLEDQLGLLRRGDVMTYCFYSGDGSIAVDGRILDCVWDARERGVLFDVGDGAAAFGFDTAEVAISEGFLPDTVSTDYYLHHFSNGLEHDVTNVVSKLVAAGMSPEQCWPRVSSVPATVLGLGSRIGRIAPGYEANFCVVEPSVDTETMTDCCDNVRVGTRWRSSMTVLGGEVV